MRFFDKYGSALGGVWHQTRSNQIEAGIKFGQVIVWPDHDAPGQSYAGQIAMMLHRDFDTTVPISDVFLCKVTGQTFRWKPTGRYPHYIGDGMLPMPWPRAEALPRSTASLPLP
jgi:hypothetical protein